MLPLKCEYTHAFLDLLAFKTSPTVNEGFDFDGNTSAPLLLNNEPIDAMLHRCDVKPTQHNIYVLCFCFFYPSCVSREKYQQMAFILQFAVEPK